MQKAAKPTKLVKDTKSPAKSPARAKAAKGKSPTKSPSPKKVVKGKKEESTHFH